MSSDGRVTIPKSLRCQARLDEGDELDVEITAEGILLRPCSKRDHNQSWYWTD